MIICKIFHLRQPLPEARHRLKDLGIWNDSETDPEVNCSMNQAQGTGHFEFTPRQGQRVSADIEEVPGDDPNRILFRSVGGDVELAGVIELFRIRPNLTEVVLTLEYEAVSPLHKALDALAAGLDQFLNRQLARIEGCMAQARGTGAAVSGRFA